MKQIEIEINKISQQLLLFRMAINKLLSEEDRIPFEDIYDTIMMEIQIEDDI